MSWIIKQVEVVDKYSPFHGQIVDILVKDGIITQIAPEILDVENIEEFSYPSSWQISPSWADPRVNFCDPGFEHREDLDSGSEAALFGGILHVGILPFTEPVIDKKASIKYIYDKGSHVLPYFYPLAPINKGNASTELTEMIDLYKAGAIAFVQSPQSRISKDVLIKALDYAKAIPSKIWFDANDLSLIPGAFVNEGNVHVELGLRGLSREIEELTTFTILTLAKYCNKSVHIMGLSSYNAIDLVRNAKQQGQAVSCDTAVSNLLFTDEVLHNFDTNYKLDPLLRTEKDRLELIDAVLDGTIDVITSNHQPFEEDYKKCELALASFGVIGVQTLFSALLMVLNDVGAVIEILAFRNRNILNIEYSTINIGNKVDITAFDADVKWFFNGATNKSKSSNSMFYKKELTGKAVFVANQKGVRYL